MTQRLRSELGSFKWQQDDKKKKKLKTAFGVLCSEDEVWFGGAL